MLWWIIHENIVLICLFILPIWSWAAKSKWFFTRGKAGNQAKIFWSLAQRMVRWRKGSKSLNNPSNCWLYKASWDKVPYCLKLWPGYLFLSSNFLPQPLNDNGDYTRLAFISWSSKSKLFRLWILMESGNTRAADPVDTMHHEMDSAVCSHRFYKSV